MAKAEARTGERARRRRTRTIRVERLARVEGHGALTVRVRGERVTEAHLRLFEAPRFFEGVLQGRHFTEAPDITARICGICPVAYQMSASLAVEDACGVRVDGPLRALRRLLVCGEWIESHALHVHMLHAPDFFGLADAVGLAREQPDLVRRGLRLKRVGGAIMSALGGRQIHPVNVRAGGFYRTPEPADLAPLREQLEWARDAALETARFAGGLDYPDLELDCGLLALRHPSDYPMNEGRLVSGDGLDIDPRDFEAHVEERQARHTNALQARLRGRGDYLTGPLARYNLNHDHLSPTALEAADAAGLGPTCRNPHRSIGVRAVEMVQACDDGLRIIEAYEPPPVPALELEPREARGAAATEAPRGVLFHRYDIGVDGTIRQARIIPPTSQNQRAIEESLRRTVQAMLDEPKPMLTAACERVIRSFDPCISCATHFLTLEFAEQ